MPSLHITPSGGLLTHQLIESLQQVSFNHPALAPETFAVPGRKPPTPAELNNTIAAAWEALVERWDAVERDFDSLDLSTLRARWIVPLLAALDLELEYQRADLVLEESLRFSISHLARPAGSPTEAAVIPVHTVLPTGEDTLDVRQGNRTGARRLTPHDMVQRYLNLARDARWGLVSDGFRLRLLRDYHHTYTRGYVEFDLRGIFTTRDLAAFRALYRLCHASRFTPMAAPTPAGKSRPAKKAQVDEDEADESVDTQTPAALTPLESFYQHALSTGVRVGEDLRRNVRAAIETLANGFLRATPGLLSRLGSDVGARDLYDDVLYVIYRLLFLLFAEQRGMFPGRGSLYMDEYSITALRACAERPVADDPHLDLWERLKVTFRMVERGEPNLHIFGYNGALFSIARTPLLTPPGDDSPCLTNADLLRAARNLTTIERDGVLQRISYADLSVEEMGSVYESLLDYTPRVAAVEETVDEDHEQTRTIYPGQFYLDPRGKERKTTGSYYTHPALVNELIRTALVPVLDERLTAAVPGYDPDHPEFLVEAERRLATDALLDLKVADPACGSGAFLIAADNVLGKRLAQIRTGDLYPPEAEIRRARREALAHCIYGVDLNRLAVELCKVSLWINAAVADQKLNFLDHHIKWGNSLVGIGPNQEVILREERRLDLSALEISPNAFDPLSMDERSIARAVKARHQNEIRRRAVNLKDKHQRADQHGLWQVTAVYHPADAYYAGITEASLSDPNEAERQFTHWGEDAIFKHSLFAADVWTAAFFWPHTAEISRRLEAPTETVFRRACTEGLQAFSPEFVSEVERLRKQHRFFHWPLEFPEVFGEGKPGGFDVVLGNPPWERIKLQEIEFFASYDQTIANAPNAAARRKLIAKLTESNPMLWNLYQEALRAAESTSRFLRQSGRYPLTGRGDINTYSVFAEHDRDLMAPDGRAGVIVPSGIATDFTNKDFFADLVARDQLASLFDFENRRAIFPGVHRSYKFSLLTLRGECAGAEDGADAPPDFAFFLLAVDDLNDPERRFSLTAEDFARINPNTRTTPIFRTRTDAALTRKLYEAAPVLVNEETGENPWGVRFNAMFHMTNDSHLFRTRQQLEAEGFRLHGNRFERGDEVWLPLYEAKMFWHYDHRFGSFSNSEIRGNTIQSPSQDDYKNPSYISTPWYWVKTEEVAARLPDRLDDWVIAFRDITNATNERTAIFATCPYGGYGNNAPLLLFSKETRRSGPCFCANVSSIPFDFVARKKIGGTHANFFIVQQFPVISPKVYRGPLLAYLLPKAVELIFTAWDLSQFANDIYAAADSTLQIAIQNQWKENATKTRGGNTDATHPSWGGEPNPNGFPYPPFKWDENRRARLRAELDGLYAHLYGLHRDELAYILDTFPIVRRNDEARYGEFRTKRLVLSAYDALAGSELIPAEARERSKHSVLGERAAVPVVKPAAVSTRAKPQTKPESPAHEKEPEKTNLATKPFGGERIEKGIGITPSDEPGPAEAQPKAAPEPEEPVNEATTPATDWNWYRCSACGKRVLGFLKEDHTKEAHGGKEPEYTKT